MQRRYEAMPAFADGLGVWRPQRSRVGARAGSGMRPRAAQPRSTRLAVVLCVALWTVAMGTHPPPAPAKEAPSRNLVMVAFDGTQRDAMLAADPPVLRRVDAVKVRPVPSEEKETGSVLCVCVCGRDVGRDNTCVCVCVCVCVLVHVHVHVLHVWLCLSVRSP